MNFRDFDVLSNKYKEFHDEKVKTDISCQRLVNANNYWKMREYDPVLAKYIDNNKEQEYLKNREKSNKEWGKDCNKKLPPTVRKNGLLYNPVNMKILDAEALKQADQVIKDKKEQYGLKYKIEEYHKVIINIKINIKLLTLIQILILILINDRLEILKMI